MLELLKTIFVGELTQLILAIAGLWVVVGTATTWAVCSRRHWFLRTSVVGAALSPALLIPGYDLVLIFSGQAAITAAFLTWRKFWTLREADRSGPGNDTKPVRRLPRFQFTLTDLLLAVLVIAIALAVATSVPKSTWEEWKGIGLAALVSAECCLPVLDIVFLLTGRKRLGSMAAGKFHKKKRKKASRISWIAGLVLLWCLVVPLICAGVAIFHVAIHPAPLPPTTLPSPNGYDDLVRAGGQLAKVEVPDAEEATAAELRQFVVASSQVFHAARRGLDRECQVPLSYTEADIDGCKPLQDLGWAFLAEGKLAELEGRTSDAVQSYLDVVLLGEAVSRGGVVIDAFAGWTLADMAANALASIRQTMDEKQCRKVIEALAAFDAGREPLEDIITRELLWDEHAYGKAGRVARAMGVDIFSPQEMRDEWERRAKRNQAKIRLLMCELALRQYRLEHGCEPKELAELVPECLPAVPVDPFSGRPLVYRPTSSGYELYSVGPDGVDDGGRPMERDPESDVWPGDLHVYEPALDDPAKE